MILVRDITMPCYSPLEGYRGRMRSRSGKRPIVFSAAEGFVDMPVSVPCGQCFGCRLESARQWAMRIMHEASLHEENSFITLTYSDEHLPLRGGLATLDRGPLDDNGRPITEKGAFSLFMKRLRKRTGANIRYYHCGEYGTENGRPHYHAILFGIDFGDDRYLWRISERGGHRIYRSPTLEGCWPYGQSDIGAVTFESASYVARYVMDKDKCDDGFYEEVNPETGEVVKLEPPYATMSRRPGIGLGWFEKFKDETYRDDTVVVRGREMKPPKYYDKKMEELDEELVSEVKADRAKHRNLEEESRERLAVREKVARARVDLYKKRSV